ncbi:hypothetical protein [Flagellimonas eckloniae]|nr:hypothetical protein [Allomuricauda eckloniae]
MKYLLLILLVCFTSCKAQKETQLTSEQKDSGMILIAHDEYSGISEYETMVIRDAKSLNKFYAKINRTRKPGLPVPTLDFSKEIVLVVCLGEQKGKKLLTLSSNEETENEVSVSIEMVDSDEVEKDKVQYVSYPFYIYKIPHTSKTINFEKIGW